MLLSLGKGWTDWSGSRVYWRRLCQCLAKQRAVRAPWKTWGWAFNKSSKSFKLGLGVWGEEDQCKRKQLTPSNSIISVINIVNLLITWLALIVESVSCSCLLNNVFLWTARTISGSKFLIACKANLERMGSYMRAFHRSWTSIKVKWQLNLTPRYTVAKSLVWKDKRWKREDNNCCCRLLGYLGWPRNPYNLAQKGKIEPFFIVT